MGMSQYSSPILTTRMYISSFNYIEKMSNEKYPKGDKETWNLLFNAFLLTHKDNEVYKLIFCRSKDFSNWHDLVKV
jgi:deoxyribodipyrimidine photolyase-like uncharacterized protein